MSKNPLSFSALKSDKYEQINLILSLIEELKK